MSTKAKTAVFTTGICVVAVALFGAIAIASHAETETAGCATKRVELNIERRVLDALGPDEPDPCTTSGLWEIPSQIRPGTYRVTPTGSIKFGSWTVCRTTTCRFGTPELIDKGYTTEPSVLTIPKNAKYIRTSDVHLEPVN